VNNDTICTPTSTANMVPMRSGTPSPTPTPSSNMIRRSIRTPDPILPPGIPSRASAVNSTDASLNGRSVTTARWNKHYLIPRDPALYGGVNANKIGTDPIPSFTAPDWVLVTSAGPQILAAPNTSVVGRYSYAIYDEGGLLDIN